MKENATLEATAVLCALAVWHKACVRRVCRRGMTDQTSAVPGGLDRFRRSGFPRLAPKNAARNWDTRPFDELGQFQASCIPETSQSAAGLKPGSLQKALLDAALKRRSTKTATGYNNSETALDCYGRSCLPNSA